MNQARSNAVTARLPRTDAASALARLLEGAIPIPGLSRRIGLDAIIGLVPGGATPKHLSPMGRGRETPAGRPGRGDWAAHGAAPLPPRYARVDLSPVGRGEIQAKSNPISAAGALWVMRPTLM